jgi:carboxymethylenebutenolidase
MCDELTERDRLRLLAEKKLGRREFSVGVGATAAVLVAGCGSDSDDDAAGTSAGGTGGSGGKSAAGSGGSGGKSAAGSGGSGGKAAAGAGGTLGQGGTGTSDVKLKSSVVEIETPDGTADAYFVYPETGKHPAVIVWPDILGLRDAFKTMADRLAGDGYAVLVINQYYRSAKAPVLDSWEEWQSDEGKAKLQPMLDKVTTDAVVSDGKAMVDWIDNQSAVDTSKKIGTSGYCMGGPFTFRTAAARNDRVGAFASLHGGGLVAEGDSSPHLLLKDIKASALIAIAMNDDMRQPDAKTVLMDTAKSAGIDAEITVYPAQHGWCAIDSAAYDEEQANKAYDRMIAVFGKAL